MRKNKSGTSRFAIDRHLGIRSRVMLYLVVFVGFVILLLWLFQIVLLDSFYRAYITRQVESTAQTLEQEINSDDVSLLAEQLASRNDLCVLLLDSEGNALISAEGAKNCFIHKASPSALQWWWFQAVEADKPITRLFHINPMMPNQFFSVDNQSAPVTVQPFEGIPPADESGHSRALNDGQTESDTTRTHSRRDVRRQFGDTSHMLSLLNARPITMADGMQAVLLLNAQITPVSATVNALRSQLLTITVLVLLGAIILAAIISRRISTPIIETNTAARSLSHSQYTRPPHASSYREISELNDTLVKAAEDLGRVESLQHELIANISHDLRTPLTMIAGYAEVMRDIPDENTPENMQIIIDESSRLSTLVNELLDFSRMQAGVIEMHPAPYGLTTSVQAMINRIGGMTARDGYVIHFQPDRYVTVLADEQRIGQVLYNLIGNALTYTGEDKTVTVTQTIHDGFARISVSDSGNGISADELPFIWNRYYRTKETHRRAIIGSGLGLHIVHSILEKHGSPFGVDSEQEHGTTFWFDVPLADSDE